jgi:ABC-2 type transport system permease protein
MRAILDIVLRDLRARLRDRSAIVIGVVAPLALTLVMSLISGGVESTTRSLGYVPAPSTTATDQVLTSSVFPSLVARKVARITTYPDMATAPSALNDGDVEAILHVSAGASAGTTQLGAIEVARTTSAPVSGAVAGSIANATASQMNATATLLAAERVAGNGPDAADPQRLAFTRIMAQPAPITMANGTSQSGGLSPKTQIAVGMATFFLFFTVQFGVLGLLQERREGTLARLLAAVTPRQVLVAKLLVSFVLGVISMTVLLAVARAVLDAQVGSPLGVALLVVCGVGAATATVALVVGLAKTPEQAGVAQSMVALVLGILGGSFFPMARAGDVARIATKCTPHYWFNEGLVRMTGGGSWTASLMPAGMLVLFTVVVGIPGVMVARRSVRP